MSEKRTTAAGGMEHSFGFRAVAPADKQPMVNEVFDKVARRYDVMNDFMSAGLHRVWKDAMVTWLNPPKRPDYLVLDVAGGTGDIAFRIVEASGRQAHATVLDINGEMLAVGTERAAKRGYGDNVDFVEANAQELPFPDGSFDAVLAINTIHNMNRDGCVRAVKEVERLAPGKGFIQVDSYLTPEQKEIFESWVLTARFHD
ncbi:MAG: class I SAM-dependent methyltransferase, partial [Nitratireductor sp.]